MKKLLCIAVSVSLLLTLTACKNSDTPADEVGRYKRMAGVFENYYIGCGEMVDGIPDVNSVEHGETIDRLPQEVKNDQSGELRRIVDEFLAETDLEARYALTEELLNIVFDTNSVEDTNEFFSDKKLTVINEFWASETAKPPINEEEAYWLEQSYQYLVGHYMLSMIFATVKEDFNYVKKREYDDGTVYPYMWYFLNHIYYGVRLDAFSDQMLADLSLSMAHFAKLSDKSWRINSELRAYLDMQINDEFTWDSDKEKLTHALEVMDGAVYGAIRADDSGGVLEGTDKAEVLFGGNGNDTINGGASHDWLIGGEGDDTLDGGEGNDCLEGGLGDDTYVFGRNSGSDIIIDFDGNNTIRFDGIPSKDVTAWSFSEEGLEDHVKLCIAGTGAELVIKNYFSDEKYRQFELEFLDGKMNIEAPESPLSRIDQEPEETSGVAPRQ